MVLKMAKNMPKFTYVGVFAILGLIEALKLYKIISIL